MIRVARIFNTYGPNMAINDGRVISNFITQALQNNPITIYGDGTQTRSFCYVDDMVDGLIKLMEQDKIIGPMNLGNPDEISILDLAEEIINMTKSKSKIILKSLPDDDPVRRKPDITLAKNQIKWEPKVSRKEGLSSSIKYFKSLM